MWSKSGLIGPETNFLLADVWLSGLRCPRSFWLGWQAYLLADLQAQPFGGRDLSLRSPTALFSCFIPPAWIAAGPLSCKETEAEEGCCLHWTKMGR